MGGKISVQHSARFIPRNIVVFNHDDRVVFMEVEVVKGEDAANVIDPLKFGLFNNNLDTAIKAKITQDVIYGLRHVVYLVESTSPAVPLAPDKGGRLDEDSARQLVGLLAISETHFGDFRPQEDSYIITLRPINQLHRKFSQGYRAFHYILDNSHELLMAFTMDVRPIPANSNSQNRMSTLLAKGKGLSANLLKKKVTGKLRAHLSHNLQYADEIHAAITRESINESRRASESAEYEKRPEEVVISASGTITLQQGVAGGAADGKKTQRHGEEGLGSARGTLARSASNETIRTKDAAVKYSATEPVRGFAGPKWTPAGQRRADAMAERFPNFAALMKAFKVFAVLMATLLIWLDHRSG
eukprot:comp24264_c3_seq2/m.45158 comp24264_c3_seq2/g.45158  ORF comp24264_c3_seq2/g.45158 comp24264_c3_seq2/m.45158 type:complete len:358 (-) comp24264_c3_seq2:674-1747(-)